jgi:hypothetical protein
MIHRHNQRLEFILQSLQPILQEAAELCCQTIHEQNRTPRDLLEGRIQIVGVTALAMAEMCQGHLLLLGELLNILQDLDADEAIDAQEAGQPPN